MNSLLLGEDGIDRETPNFIFFQLLHYLCGADHFKH